MKKKGRNFSIKNLKFWDGVLLEFPDHGEIIMLIKKEHRLKRKKKRLCNTFSIRMYHLDLILRMLGKRVQPSRKGCAHDCKG